MPLVNWRQFLSAKSHRRQDLVQLSECVGDVVGILWGLGGRNNQHVPTCSSAKDQQIANFLSFKLSRVKHQTLRALLPYLPFLANRNQTDMLSNFLPWCLLPNQTPIVHTHTHIYIHTHIVLVQVESSGHFTSLHFTTRHSFTTYHIISLHFSKFATHGLLHCSIGRGSCRVFRRVPEALLLQEEVAPLRARSGGCSRHGWHTCT